MLKIDISEYKDNPDGYSYLQKELLKCQEISYIYYRPSRSTNEIEASDTAVYVKVIDKK